MSLRKVPTLGLEVSLEVPDSVEQFDLAANRPGACLDEAINNIVYRVFLAAFRDLFLHGDEALGIVGVEEQTGIDRLTEVTKPAKKNEAGEVIEDEVVAYAESEQKYFKRVCATKNVEPTAFSDLAQQVADKLRFDPKKQQRTPAGPKKVAKIYISAAETIQKEGRLEQVAAKLSQLLSTTESAWTVTPTVESVARAIAEDKRRQREKENLAAAY